MILLRPKDLDFPPYVWERNWRTDGNVILPDTKIAIYPTKVGAEVLVTPDTPDLDQDDFACVLCAGTVMFDVMCITLRTMFHISDNQLIKSLQDCVPLPQSDAPAMVPVLMGNCLLTDQGWCKAGVQEGMPRRYGVAFEHNVFGAPDFTASPYVAAHALASAINCFARANSVYCRALYTLTERGW